MSSTIVGKSGAFNRLLVLDELFVKEVNITDAIEENEKGISDINQQLVFIKEHTHEQAAILSERIDYNKEALSATNPVANGQFSGPWANTNNVPLFASYYSGPYAPSGSRFYIGVDTITRLLKRESDVYVPIRRVETGYSTDVLKEKYEHFKDSFLITPLSTGGTGALNELKYPGVVLSGFHGLRSQEKENPNILSLYDYVDAVNQIWTDEGLTSNDTFIQITLRFGEYIVEYSTSNDEYFKENASSFTQYINGKVHAVIPTTGTGPKVDSHYIDFSQGYQKAELEIVMDNIKAVAGKKVVYTQLWSDTNPVYEEIADSGLNNITYSLWWSTPWVIKAKYNGVKMLSPLYIDPASPLGKSLNTYMKFGATEKAAGLGNIYEHPVVQIGILDTLVTYNIVSDAGIVPTLESTLASSKSGKVDNRILELIGTSEDEFFAKPMTAGYNLPEVFYYEINL